jgi:L-fuculose-phosphate aldolase
MLEREREQVASAARRLATAGLVAGTSGNISARRDDRVAITPTGGVLAELDADRVSVIDLEGHAVEGELEPTSELDLHLSVYRRYGTGAVVHTHAPVATALSCVIDELPCIHYEMLLLGGSVRVAPYRTFGTPELAQAVVEALDGRTAALMSNHGAVTHGADVDAAVRATELLEWAAGVYWRASLVGKPRVLGSDELQAVVETAVSRGYGTTHPLERAS